jgi:hypothetical protein
MNQPCELVHCAAYFSTVRMDMSNRIHCIHCIRRIHIQGSHIQGSTQDISEGYMDNQCQLRDIREGNYPNPIVTHT